MNVYDLVDFIENKLMALDAEYTAGTISLDNLNSAVDQLTSDNYVDAKLNDANDKEVARSLISALLIIYNLQ